MKVIIEQDLFILAGSKIQLSKEKVIKCNKDAVMEISEELRDLLGDLGISCFSFDHGYENRGNFNFGYWNNKWKGESYAVKHGILRERRHV